MARPRFRLEAKLRMLNHGLERAQLELADELRKLEENRKDLALQAKRVEKAGEGRRQAAQSSPLDLGAWQNFLQRQLEELQQKKDACAAQERQVEAVRSRLLEIHRECKKFEGLKEKQARAFMEQERKQEQAVLDETGQVLFNRKRFTSQIKG